MGKFGTRWNRPPRPTRARFRARARARPPFAVCDRDHAASVATPSERERSSVALDLVRCAPAARRRAAFEQGRPLPSCIGSRRFRTSGRVFLPPLGRDGRTAYPSLAPVGETHPDVAIAESPYHSDSAGPDSVLQPPWSAWRLRRPRRCCYGPLLRPATRRNLARASAHHLTTPRGPRDEALRNSATPTGASRRRIQAGGRQIRNPKSEIPNSTPCPSP